MTKRLNYWEARYVGKTYAFAKDECLRFAEKVRQVQSSTAISLYLADIRSVTQFQAVLPPELREMVYDHVWYPSAAKEAFSSVRYDTLSMRPWLVDCKQSLCECFRHYEIAL
jgi:hypothetical protein